MKMMLMLLFAASLTTVGCASQESGGYTKEYQRALRYGAKAMVTVAVVDEDGLFVSNANVKVFFRMSTGRSEGEVICGQTDTNGLFVAEGVTSDLVFITIEKEGCYVSRRQYKAQSLEAGRLKGGRWLPWNPTLPVVLREIRNPTPMYATSVYKHSIQSETDMGFDCEKQDWVAPHGKGVVADFLVRFSPIDASEYDGACRLALSSIDPEGGFIRKRKVLDSGFVSEYEAPPDGYARFQVSRERKLKFYERNPDDLSEEEYLIFKSRIIRDKDGKIVSANHGKIYGKLEYRFSRDLKCGSVGFVYYFNPTPNDRNLEFDTNMTKNLFGEGSWQMPFPRLP